MQRPPSLWTDPDALRRLAQVGRRATNGQEATPQPAYSNGRLGFGFHAVEAPRTLVGGDYSDGFFVSEHELALVIADVAGKGLAAAILRNVMRSVVRNVASLASSPGDLLTRLERILCEAELGSAYSTVFVGWYDTRVGTLRYANAGHPLPYRIDHAGRVTPFGQVTGPILGILGHERFDDGEGVLDPGDRLVLFTDGITEAQDGEGEFFGDERLMQALARAADSRPQSLCEGLLAEVRQFQGQRLQDDVALLVLERTASGRSRQR